MRRKRREGGREGGTMRELLSFLLSRLPCLFLPLLLLLLLLLLEWYRWCCWCNAVEATGGGREGGREGRRGRSSPPCSLFPLKVEMTRRGRKKKGEEEEEEGRVEGYFQGQEAWRRPRLCCPFIFAR